MKILTTLLSLLLVCMAVNAQIYSYVDANGNTIYTDNPPKGQQTRLVDIESTPSSAKAAANLSQDNVSSPSNNQQPIDSDEVKTIKLSPQGIADVASTADSSSSTDEQSESSTANNKRLTRYTSLQIIVPAPQAVITNSGGQMMIQVKSNPALATGHKYRFLIDNQVMGELASPVLSLNDVARGEHKLKVVIIDEHNKVIAESAEQIFFIKQTTLADKRRTKPCKFADYGVRPECPLKDKPPPESLLRKTVNTVKSVINTAVNAAAETAVNSAIP